MRKITRKIVYSLWILVFLLSSCTNPLGQSSKTHSQLPEAEVVFQVVLPSALDERDGIYLEILDEITGIYFNPTRIAMTRNSDTVFMVRTQATIGSEIAYRYIKISENVVPEYDSRGNPVRMRRLVTNGPILVQDLIYSWDGNPTQKPEGRISGQIIDKLNHAPIPDMVISAAGMQTTSSSDGSFILEGLPEGTHNVVIYSKAGNYSTFQQYATIAANATTPIYIGLEKTKLVKVTFNVRFQGNEDTEQPLKIAGNLYQLGNPHTELLAGSANRADDLPQLIHIGRDRYSLTVELPAGAYIKYKYTQGDGFWNSEVDPQGNFITREYIVPEKDAEIDDGVMLTKTPNFEYVNFEVTTNPTSPDINTLYIQLNPFDWMEPIPMQRNPDGKWTVTITSPMNLIGNTSYRFCRERDCEKGLSTSAPSSFTPKADSQTISTTVEGWINYSAIFESPSIDNGSLEVIPNSDRITGVEVLRTLPDSWKNNIDSGFTDIQNLGGKWVIFTPKWSLSNLNPPMIEPSARDDGSWMEMQQLINYAKLHNLKPVLFPRLSPLDPSQILNSSGISESWDYLFFERYRRFILNFADLSEIMGLEAIIVGEPSLNSLSTIQPTGSFQWREFITELRAHFSGKIIGVVTLPLLSDYSDWLSDVDVIYVLYSPIVNEPENIIEEINSQIDMMVYPVFEKFQKPILIGLAVSSIDSAYKGCGENIESCAFRMHSPDNINLSTQSKIYNAAAVASFSKVWVNGLISRGYDPYLRSQDSSDSIYGKPAYDVLWFWFHFALNLRIQ